MQNKKIFLTNLLKDLVKEQNILKKTKKFHEKNIARSKRGHESLKILEIEEKKNLSKVVKSLNFKAKEITYLHIRLEEYKKSKKIFKIEDKYLEIFNEKYQPILDNILEDNENGMNNKTFKIDNDLKITKI